MAVYLAFRIALAVGGPAGYKVLSWVQGPGPASALANWERFRRYLQDENPSDEEASERLTAAVGTMATVATYTDPFEVRKLQIVFAFATGSPTGDDVRVITFHHLRLSGGAPSDAWGSTDFEAVEAAFDAFWTTMKPWHRLNLSLAQYRWYKDGPAIEPPQEPVRVIDRAVTGTAADSAYPGGIPPQVAITVSEKTATRRHWGRFYWPQPAYCKSGALLANVTFTSGGRFASAILTDLANASDTFYEACLTAAVPVVVYSKAKPEREGATGTLPAQGALAITVDNLQVDDVPDVMRSRRFDAPTLRVQRAIG
jgi:hypothetical protein